MQPLGLDQITVFGSGLSRPECVACTREHMNIGAARRLRNITSVTFGGPELKTVYLGSLFGDGLFTFRSPVAGAIPAHWEF